MGEDALVQTDRCLWTCEKCAGSGIVSYAPNAAVYDVVYLIQDDHDSRPTICQFDLGRVRVRLLTEHEGEGDCGE